MSVELKLDNISKTFLAGDEITGEVIVKFQAKKTIRTISVEFNGNTTVSWCNFYRTNFTSSQTHFKHHIVLHGEQSRQKNVHMEPGTYSYPFQYILPASIPSSFEGLHGNTKYVVNAAINIPWEKTSLLSCSEEITVYSIVALDSLVKAHRSLKVEINDKTYGHIQATVRTFVSGFVSGEEIPFKLNVKNQSKLDILDVLLQIQRTDTYNANKPYWCTKIETILLQDSSLGPVDANTFRNIDAKIVIPELIPSGLGYCPIIDVEYVCRLVCCLSNETELSHSDVIFIGTIPLNRTETDSNTSEESTIYY